MTELYFGVSDNFGVREFQNRRAIDEIAMIMSAFDCVVPDESGIYCSSDITTGRRYYELLLVYEVHSEEELRRKLGQTKYREAVKTLKDTNIARGLEFTELVRKYMPGRLLVNPGPFAAAGFKQEHYLYLWESVIIRKIREAWFNEDWEYSNGCTLEYAIAAKKGIPRFDRAGKLLEASCAVGKIGRAVEDLRTRGFSVDKLEWTLDLIRDTQVRSGTLLLAEDPF